MNTMVQAPINPDALHGLAAELGLPDAVATALAATVLELDTATKRKQAKDAVNKLLKAEKAAAKAELQAQKELEKALAKVNRKPSAATPTPKKKSKALKRPSAASSSSAKKQAVEVRVEVPVEAVEEVPVESVEEVQAVEDVPLEAVVDAPANKAKATLQLAKSLPTAARPPADWNGTSGSYVVHDFSCRVGVWLHKKCFYVYGALKVPQDRQANKKGDLQIGWGSCSSIANAWDIAESAASDTD
jgi:hypothetical protein